MTNFKEELYKALAKHSDLEAEVARLRERIEAQAAAVDQAHDVRCAALRDLATERTAQAALRAELEATKAQLADAVVLAMGRASAETFYAEAGARKAAEQRVAELERKHGGDGPGSHASDLAEMRAQTARAEAAEQRVAELERAIDQYKHDEECNRAGLLLTISSARTLLEQLADGYGDNEAGDELIGGARDWLRAHPEPATPAAEARANE